MRFSNKNDWLAWQESLHPRKIDLGLDRVRHVAEALAVDAMPCTVVTVAGTNGKGSSVALLETILSAQGYRVGAYTSPHLVSYNERIRVLGQQVSDEALCAAFDRVDQARNATTLSFFEFGTLAALDIFSKNELDIVILEVGLGGRLDAVNILDADVSLVTVIGLDHMDWLGDSLESIAGEKAGIFRPDKPAICADPNPPASLREHARSIGARWYARGSAFDCVIADDCWDWRSAAQSMDGLPRPRLGGLFQYDNASGVLMVLECLRDRHGVSRGSIERGLASVQLPGRMQVVGTEPLRLLDVAHNAQAATALAAALSSCPQGKVSIVLGMLENKDVEGVCEALSQVVDAWYLAGLAVPGGLTSDMLARRMGARNRKLPVFQFGSVAQAYEQAQADAEPSDLVLVCGSFYTVAAILQTI